MLREMSDTNEAVILTERRSALREDFIAFHDRYTNALGICVPRDYWVTIGTRR